MGLKIQTIIAGSLRTNTYILEKNNHVVIIDPACKIEKIEYYLKDKQVLAVLLTHGHFDHIKTCDALYKKYNMPIYIHKDDEFLIRSKKQSQNFGLREVIYVSSPCFFYEEGELVIDDFKFNIMFTSGHTKGSVCIRVDNHLFTGDTLFHLSVGRTDLQGGSDSDLKNSLNLLKSIKDDLLIYPGHEELSTLDFERNNNIYLKD